MVLHRKIQQRETNIYLIAWFLVFVKSCMKLGFSRTVVVLLPQLILLKIYWGLAWTSIQHGAPYSYLFMPFHQLLIFKSHLISYQLMDMRYPVFLQRGSWPFKMKEHSINMIAGKTTDLHKTNHILIY